jgi:hypothetical protein
MSSYLFRKEEDWKAKIFSSIDGKEVEFNAVLKPITKARQKVVNSAQLDYYQELMRIKKEYNINDSGAPADIELSEKMMDDINKAQAVYYKSASDAIFNYVGEQPSIEFFSSEDFEHDIFVKCIDFFLQRLKD